MIPVQKPAWQRGLRTFVQVILAALVVFVPSRLTVLDLPPDVELFLTACLAGLFAWVQNHADQLPD